MTKPDEIPPGAARLASFALATGSVFALAIFLYSCYHGWTGQRTDLGPLSVGLYYVAPLALAVFLLASLRLPPIRQAQLALICFSATTSVYGLELLVQSRFLSPDTAAKSVMIRLADSRDRKKTASELARQWGVEIDTRTADEVIADLRTQGVDALPIIAPANHLLIAQPDGSIKSAIALDGQEVLPLAAVSRTVTVLCNESGQWIDYRSDERGFSNAIDIWQSNHLDIAALGDSFTHGYCVPADRTFVALIRQRYPATINLGIAGDGPLLMLAKFQEYVVPRRPRIVLWFYFEGNDLIDLQRERRSPLLRNYLNEGFTQSALLPQAELDRAMVNEIPRLRALEEFNRLRRQDTRLAGRLRSLATLSTLRQRLGLAAGMDPAERESTADLQTANMDAFRDLLRQTKRRTETWGGQLYFVYLPEWSRYTSATSWGKSHRTDVLDSVRGLGIHLVDLDSTFRDSGDPLSLFPFRAVGHYNEGGHRAVAAAVLKSIDPRP